MLGIGLGLNKGKKVGTNYISEANLYFAQLPTQPDIIHKSYINDFIKIQISSGNFSKHDRLWIRGNQYQDGSYVSIVNPTSTISALISTPTWTQYQGYRGSTGKGLDTKFIPSIDGVNYNQNSACIWIYSLDNLKLDNAAGLASSDAGFTNVVALFPRQVDGKTDGLLNSTTDTLVAVENSMGLISVAYDGTTIRIYQNGVLKGSQIIASTGLSTHSIYELTWNLAGSLFGSWTGRIFASGIGSGDIDQVALFNEVSDLAANFGNVNRTIIFGDSFPYGSGATTRLNDRYTTLWSNNKGLMEDNRGVPGQSVNQTATSHFIISDIPQKKKVDKYLCLFWSMVNDASLSNGGTQSVVDTTTAYQSIIDTALSKGWSVVDMIMANDYYIVDTTDVPLTSYLLFRTAMIALANTNGILYIENYLYETANGGATLVVSAVPVINNHPNNLGQTAISTNIIANT